MNQCPSGEPIGSGPDCFYCRGYRDGRKYESERGKDAVFQSMRRLYERVFSAASEVLPSEEAQRFIQKLRDLDAIRILEIDTSSKRPPHGSFGPEGFKG